MKLLERDPSTSRPALRIKLGIVLTLSLLVIMLCLLSSISQAQPCSTPLPEVGVDAAYADQPTGKLFVP